MSLSHPPSLGEPFRASPRRTASPLRALGGCIEEHAFDSGAPGANFARLKGPRGWQLTLGRGVHGVERRDETVAGEVRERPEE